MSAVPGIGRTELIGRVVTDRRYARKAKVHERMFRPKLGVRTISVQRLSLIPMPDSAKIAGEIARKRGKEFHGWAVLTVVSAEQNGRRVDSDPLVDNLQHANIVLPSHVASNPGELKVHAAQLAAAAVLHPPDSTELR